jgi:hypothetical protein
MAVTNLRMVVKQLAGRGLGELIARNTVVVGTFPAVVTLSICVRYDGVVPPHQYVEAYIETPSGSIADRSSAYTGTQRTNHGEVTLSVKLTANESGVYTIRATLDNRDVPPQKISIRQAGAA